MKIEVLREFVVFARCMNFSVAARELFISQPSLSTHIRDLEGELGFELVERIRPLRLTEAGMAFLDCAQETLAVFDDGVRRCRGVVERPPVRIVAQPGFAEVAAVLDSLGDIPFVVDTGFKGVGMLEDLARGAIDVLGTHDPRLSPTLMEKVRELGLDFFTLRSDFMAIQMSRKNPLARLHSLTRKDLDGATFGIYDAGYFELWSQLIQGILGPDVCAYYKLVPLESQAGMPFQDLREAVHLCGRDHLHDIAAHRDDLVFFDTLDGEPIELDYVVVHRVDGNSPAVEQVLGRFREEARGRGRENQM